MWTGGHTSFKLWCAPKRCSFVHPAPTFWSSALGIFAAVRVHDHHAALRCRQSISGRMQGHGNFLDANKAGRRLALCVSARRPRRLLWCALCAQCAMLTASGPMRSSCFGMAWHAGASAANRAAPGHHCSTGEAAAQHSTAQHSTAQHSTAPKMAWGIPGLQVAGPAWAARYHQLCLLCALLHFQGAAGWLPHAASKTPPWSRMSSG
jgi:hypothetical protein